MLYRHTDKLNMLASHVGVGNYERLHREHGALHERNNALFRELTLICEGWPADRETLQRMLDDYIDICRKHIRLESREIFPIAQGTLTPTELRKTEKMTRYCDDPLFSRSAGLTERL